MLTLHLQVQCYEKLFAPSAFDFNIVCGQICLWIVIECRWFGGKNGHSSLVCLGFLVFKVSVMHLSVVIKPLSTSKMQKDPGSYK